MPDRPHILVVDDEPQITRVLRTSLSAQGYDIRTRDHERLATQHDHYGSVHAID
jgi:DNA-binding response OmpR family regulator